MELNSSNGNEWYILKLLRYILVEITSFAGVNNIRNMFENKNKQNQIQNLNTSPNKTEINTGRTRLPSKFTLKNESPSVKIFKISYK